MAEAVPYAVAWTRHEVASAYIRCLEMFLPDGLRPELKRWSLIECGTVTLHVAEISVTGEQARPPPFIGCYANSVFSNSGARFPRSPISDKTALAIRR